MSFATLGLLGVVVTAGLTGCDGCGGSKVVPFGLDAGRSGGSGAGAGAGGGMSAGSAMTAEPGAETADTPDPPEFRPIQGRAHPAGTRTLRVGAETMRLGEGDGELRVSLVLDADADGDEDVFGVRVTDQQAQLVYGSQHPGRIAQRVLSTVSHADQCQVESAAGRSLSPRLGVLSLDLQCPSGLHESMWLFSIEERPRLRERFGTAPSAEGAVSALGSDATDGGEGEVSEGAEDPPAAVAAPMPPLPMRLSIAAQDVDDDGREDIRLAVRLGSAEPLATITWRDRTSGLSRDRAEPEASLMQMTVEAAGALRRDAPRARALAERVLSLHRALCREPGQPRLFVGESEGLQCGRSHASGKAAALVAATYAQAGEVFEAARAARAMTRQGRRVTPADRAMLQRAYDHAPRPAGLTLTDLGEVPGTGPLAFLDDDFVQAPGGRVLAVAGAQAEGVSAPAARPGAGRISDPNGRFEAVRVGRGCGGYLIELRAADPVMHGTPRAVSLETSPAAACADARTIETPEDDGGWVLLGWAPQGILVTRQDEVRVVPLDGDAEPAGPAHVLPPGTRPPAPLRGAAVDRQGRAFVVATPEGLVLRGLGPDTSTRFVRPEGWTDLEGPIRAVAIAPGRRAAALHRGTHVYVLRWGS